MVKTNFIKNPSSFRDPSGYVFEKDGKIYRQITPHGLADFNLLMNSGLYKELTSRKWLIEHKEVKIFDSRVIQPEKVPFVTYPYEWCFGELKEAALLTLDIQILSLDHGMSLKDSSAYNIQFLNGQAVFIDTTSFEVYSEGKPWVAYRQFCEHFLAPLSLMAKKDLRLGFLQPKFLDGIPLELAVSLLPVTSLINKEILLHLYFHSLSVGHRADRAVKKSATNISKNNLRLILESLKKGIKSLNLSEKTSFWKKYYEFSNYTPRSFSAKKRELQKMIKSIRPKVVLDLGSNTGIFSKIAAKDSKFVISTDYDPEVVQLNYSSLSSANRKKILPLVLDAVNPSPGLGWKNIERKSFFNRINPDCVMALALVHHLAITNNLTFEMLTSFFADLTRKYLIIEFPDIEDSQVKDMFNQSGDRKDYNTTDFEKIFSKRFKLVRKIKIKNSFRYLYLFSKRSEKLI